jgi:hypothetical protein
MTKAELEAVIKYHKAYRGMGERDMEKIDSDSDSMSIEKSQ